jgi:hypothetical protein
MTEKHQDLLVEVELLVSVHPDQRPRRILLELKGCGVPVAAFLQSITARLNEYIIQCYCFEDGR